MQFDQEDKYLAGGYSDGFIRIFSIATGTLFAELKPQYKFEVVVMPICGIRFN